MFVEIYEDFKPTGYGLNLSDAQKDQLMHGGLRYYLKPDFPIAPLRGSDVIDATVELKYKDFNPVFDKHGFLGMQQKQ